MSAVNLSSHRGPRDVRLGRSGGTEGQVGPSSLLEIERSNASANSRLHDRERFRFVFDVFSFRRFAARFRSRWGRTLNHMRQRGAHRHVGDVSSPAGGSSRQPHRYEARASAPSYGCEPRGPNPTYFRERLERSTSRAASTIFFLAATLGGKVSFASSTPATSMKAASETPALAQKSRHPAAASGETRAEITSR